uniref:ATP synthase F0 subunit 8 n=1 Tax=Angaria neglecta TaxID=1740283 RepID=A0A0S1F5K0_9VEST|nr:ATP synthase F0 subunit 8 [Angaria neglecta]ALK03352.1 ATP synthase F0 subunit 8 [Angaria neglecta]
MPQLAPVNWLLLFLFFWFTVALVSCVIWWSFNNEYKVDSGIVGSNNSEIKPVQQNKKSWSW